MKREYLKGICFDTYENKLVFPYHNNGERAERSSWKFKQC